MSVHPLERLIVEGSQRNPAACCLTDLQGHSLSYADVEAETRKRSSTLNALETSPTIAVVQMRNSIEAALVALGVLRSRHALLCVHPELPNGTVDAIRRGVRPGIWISAVEEIDHDPSAGAFDGHFPPHLTATEYLPTLLTLTSGSTGLPKPIVASHRQVTAALSAIARRLEYRDSDVIAMLSPLAFDYGLYQLLLAFESGASLVIDHRLNTVQGAIAAVGRAGVTVLPVVPSFLRSIVNSDLITRVDTTAVRLVTTTGDLLTERDIERTREKFQSAAIVPMYGLSECKRVAITPPSSEKARPTDGIGLPLDLGDVAIVEQTGLRLADDTAGELVVIGPHLTYGYLSDPVATRDRFPIGARTGIRILRSGDRLRQDRDGWLSWCGRNSHLVKSSGYRVDLSAIESAITETRLALEVGAFGRDDEDRGQVPVAVVHVAADRDLETLRQQIALRLIDVLPRWAQPELHLVTSPLPKTSNGKIDRSSLGLAAIGGSRPSRSSDHSHEHRATHPPLFVPAVDALPASRQFINCHTQALLSAYDIPLSLESVELLATTPFGIRSEPHDPQRLLVPFLDPDAGIDRVCEALGLSTDIRWWNGDDDRAAIETLDQWLLTGSVLVGPVDLGRLAYNPAAETTVGADHYIVVLGRRGDGYLVRDPEGFVLVGIAADTFVEAWRATDVPEGRGSFTMRRLYVNEPFAWPSSDELTHRTLTDALDNMLAATKSENGGAGAFSLLLRVPSDATTYRALSFLGPATSRRYMLASTFFAHCSKQRDVLGDVAAALNDQAMNLGRLNTAVFSRQPLAEHLESSQAGEERLAEAVGAASRSLGPTRGALL